MAWQSVPAEQVQLESFSIWANRWFLLTAGDYAEKAYNTMTVAWGSFGTMWNKPFVQVVVRPTRYTYEFIEKYDTFTLCAFAAHYHKVLAMLGSRSGRDGDKITASGLTPVAASKVAAPAFAEAEWVFECRKIYWNDFIPAQFLLPEIENNYPHKDYHRIYFGQVMAVLREKS